MLAEPVQTATVCFVRQSNSEIHTPSRLVFPFEEKLATAWPLAQWQDVTVLFAVSGGADSVAMLRAISALKQQGEGKLWVGHFNHRLRGQASDEDAQFVKTLSEELDVPCEIGVAACELQEISAGEGLEATARDARYRFLHSLAEQIGARFIVTAHTADDQVETILHRILRGTGLRGLSGIRRTRQLSNATTIIRPMLSLTRNDVRTYLATLNATWREDESNADLRFTRNRIRRELLPLLTSDFNPSVASAIQRLGILGSELNQFLTPMIDALFEQAVVKQQANRIELASQPLAQQSGFLIRELLASIWERQAWPAQNMSHEHWCELERLARLPFSAQCSETLRQSFPGLISVERTADRLILMKPPPQQEPV